MRTFFVWFIMVVSLFANDLNSSLLANSITTQWKDMDKSLQEYIIQHEKGINESIPQFKQPFKPLTQEEIDNFKLPKLLYSRDDMRKLLSYVKYLIDQNRTKDATNIYITVIDGLNNADKSYEMINIIFHIVITNDVLKSLEYDMAYLSKEDKARLKSQTPKLFLLSMEDFDKAWRNNLALSNKFLKSNLINYLPSHRVEAIMKQLEEKKLNFYQKLFSFEVFDDAQKLMNQTQKQSNIFFTQNSKQMEQLKMIAQAHFTSETKHIQKITLDDTLIVDMLFYVSLTKIIQTKQDCLNAIQLNQKVLNLL